MMCEVCRSAERTEQLIRYTITIEGRLVVVENVPATVCPNCGDRSFRPDVVEAVNRTIWAKEAPARVIEAPVYEFAL